MRWESIATSSLTGNIAVNLHGDVGPGGAIYAAHHKNDSQADEPASIKLSSVMFANNLPDGFFCDDKGVLNDTKAFTWSTSKVC